VSYSVRVSGSAKHELKRLRRDAQERVAPVLLQLQNDPFPAGYKKLKGGLGYRVRVGEYRVLYEINIAQKTIVISAIVHRKDAY
jgi:mRNA interferase RelE/StbE